MDRKFNNIDEKINGQAKSFKFFLECFINEKELWGFLCDIAKLTDVYIFSGVIRNFLLGESLNRDIDIVICGIDRIKLTIESLSGFEIRQNSFGGYKLNSCCIDVDIWGLENTWTIATKNLRRNPYTLVNTAFFNFSSIVYDFNKQRFIYNDKFVDFYTNKTIDVVNPLNPDKALCIVNTMYYSIKYNLGIRYDLCKWIVDNYRSEYDYLGTQRRHFRKIIFTENQINRFYTFCLNNIISMKQNKRSFVIRLKSNW